MRAALFCLFLVTAVFQAVPCDGVPIPDSADLIPLPGPGLAYGGIPYGSVSGMLNSYFGGPYQLNGISSGRSLGGGLQRL